MGFGSAVVALVLDARVAGDGWTDMIALVAVVLAGSSAVIAAASFWPRDFRVLDVERVREDALGRMPDVLTRVALLDTHASVIGTNRDLLHDKAVRLKVALVLLVVAAVLLAGGIVVASVGGLS